MHDGLLVIDADAHKMENPVIFFDYVEASQRERLGSRELEADFDAANELYKLLRSLN